VKGSVVERSEGVVVAERVNEGAWWPREGVTG
jgi:hypothetical protein